MALPRALSVGRITADFYRTPVTEANLDPLRATLESIQSARKTFLFAMYSFTNPSIAEALVAAQQRGVAVRGVLDREQAAGPLSMAHALRVAGLDVRLDGRSGLMHDKAWVADGKTTGLGSYNWTFSAQHSNVEVLLISRGRTGNRLAAALAAQIDAAYTSGTPLTA